MSAVINSYCSWCNSKARHNIIEANKLRRNIYKCMKCKALSVQCRLCSNMAKTGKNWDDEFCAEHDGSIASFKNLDLKINDISDFKLVFEREKINAVRVGKIIGGTVAGVAVVAPLAVLAAPGLASALGAAGLLGTAGTGTAISALSGAALTNASLAAIGGGTMAAGTVVITATGAALGGYQSGAISNNYFGEIEHFEINKIAVGDKGHKHAVIFINGFLSQEKNNATDWTSSLDGNFNKSFWYHLDWEAKNLRKLGGFFMKSPKLAGFEFAKQLAKRAAKKAPNAINPIVMISHLSDIFANPWHTTMVKASMVGILLADAIARTEGWKFTLVGHSLGARVIYYALEALSTKSEKPVVKNAFLLGGAVGGGEKDHDGWIKAVEAVSGKIYNCYSKNDDVLKYMYKCASGGISTPIGYAPIFGDHSKIFDFDCTALVEGHSAWKENFGNILNQLRDDWGASIED